MRLAQPLVVRRRVDRSRVRPARREDREADEGGEGPGSDGSSTFSRCG